MPRQSRIAIRISDKNYDQLKQLGHITDCFDDVITELLKNRKTLAAASASAAAGR